MNKALATGATFIVGVAIIAGLYISGRPGEQRLLRFDAQRLQDLTWLASVISEYHKARQVLPEQLGALQAPDLLTTIPTDPASRKAYDYEIIAEDEYRLCAEFARPSRKTDHDDFWAHGAGRQCFSIPVARGN